MARDYGITAPQQWVAPPSPAAIGQMYFDTIAKQVFVYDGLYWQQCNVPLFSSASARDAAMPTPQKGWMCVVLAPMQLLVYHGPTAGWTPPWNQPWGQIYVATRTSGDFTINVNTETVVVDLGSQTYKANRKYEIRATCRAGCSAINSRCLVRILNATDTIRAHVFDTGFPIVNIQTRYLGIYPLNVGSADVVKDFQLMGQSPGGATLTISGGAIPDCASIAAFDVGPNGDPV